MPAIPENGTGRGHEVQLFLPQFRCPLRADYSWTILRLLPGTTGGVARDRSLNEVSQGPSDSCQHVYGLENDGRGLSRTEISRVECCQEVRLSRDSSRQDCEIFGVCFAGQIKKQPRGWGWRNFGGNLQDESKGGQGIGKLRQQISLGFRNGVLGSQANKKGQLRQLEQNMTRPVVEAGLAISTSASQKMRTLREESGAFLPRLPGRATPAPARTPIYEQIFEIEVGGPPHPLDVGRQSGDYWSLRGEEDTSVEVQHRHAVPIIQTILCAEL